MWFLELTCNVCSSVILFSFISCHVESSVLVDKDNSPNWQPSTLDAVSKEKVDSYFETLGDRELVL